jgi:hypothetical protein
MKLEAAVQQLRACRQKMDTLYQKPVFDEWAIVALGGAQPAVLAYEGPRREGFEKKFHSDASPLLAEMEGRRYAVGDFEFALDARGSRFDASVRVGENTYLFCNNTYGSMQDIRGDARWLKAQAPFVDLTEKFRADPLE